MKPTFFETPADFRAWLVKNHASKTELLVGFYKKGSNRPSITWPESVDEALCYGWIDGVRKGIDGESYTIRRAVPADAEPLADLAARTFRDTFEAGNKPEDVTEHLTKTYSPARQLAEITSPDVITLLATCYGPAAFAQLRRGKPPACVTSTQTIELWRFYVDKSWQGRGIAKQLMRAVLDEASAAGADAVWLGVWERNPRAIAFYRKFGFVDVGAHEFRLGADVQTDRIMVRNLEATTN